MISEPELRRLYLEEKLTTKEIGQRFGLTQSQANRLRIRYSIPTISKSDRLDLPPLTTTQKEVLLGSIFGDGRLLSTGSVTAGYSEFHSDKQYEYLQWKASVWGAHLCSVRDGNSTKNGKTYRGHILRTHGCRELFPYWKKVYPSGAGYKVFSKLDLTEFTALSLAVWYLDDGCKSNNGYIRLAVTPDEESQQIELTLLRGFGLDPVLHSKDDPAIWLHDRASMLRFLDLVAEHIPVSMGYKLELVPRSRGVAPRDLLTEEVLRDSVGKGRGLDWMVQSTGTSTTSVRRALKKFDLTLPETKQDTWEEVKQRVQVGISDVELVDALVSLPLPKAPSTEEARRDFENLCSKTLVKIEDGLIHGGGRVGLTTCQAYFQYRYEATRESKPSVRQAWFDPIAITKAIAFQRKVGDPVYPANVFRAIKALNASPSNFRPAVAKKLVEEFSPKGGTVLDPCAGYGGRAVGAIAAGRKYVGVDPHPNAEDAFAALKECITGDLTFYNLPFEEVQLGALQADLILTSPPYFSVERYSNNPTQSWVRYPTFDLWVDRFLRVLLSKSFNHLKDGGVMLLNVADSYLSGKLIPLVQTSLDVAQSVGFVHEQTLGMLLGSFGRRRKEEPVLVLRKNGGECVVPFISVPKGPLRREVYSSTKVSEGELRNLYEVELLTDSEIGQKFGVSDVLISQQRKRFNIQSVSFRQRIEKRNPSLLPLSGLTEERLRELSVTLSDGDIAKLYGVSKPTIRNRRHQYKILTERKSK